MPPLTVLIADDEPDTRALLEELCRAHGFETTAVVDGLAALAALRESGPFGIVISDIQMPGADGFAVLEVARALSPGSQVVLVTGYDTAEARARARAGGATAFLLKPAAVTALAALLDQFAAGARGLSA